MVLRLHPALAPIKAGIFPLVKKDGMPEMAERLATDLRQAFPVFYDDAARSAAAIAGRTKSERRSASPSTISQHPMAASRFAFAMICSRFASMQGRQAM